MDNKSAEKAKLNHIIIPLAGFAVAVGALLLCIFAAAYAGAFSGDYQTDPKPDSAYLYELPAPLKNEPEIECRDGAYYGKGYYLNCYYSKENDSIGYSLILTNDEQYTVEVSAVTCALYKGAECVSNSTIIRSVYIDDMSASEFSGYIYAGDYVNDIDLVVISAVFSDEKGDYSINAKAVKRSYIYYD